MNRILILSADTELTGLIRAALEGDVQFQKATSRSTALELHEKTPYDIIFADLSLLGGDITGIGFAESVKPFKRCHPRVQLVVLTSRQTIRSAVRAVKSGASDYLTYPADIQEVRLVVTALRETTARNLELDYLRNRFWKTEWLDYIKTRNPRMQSILQALRSVAPTIATVLLMGETGTGKNLLARLIHLHSLRSDKPFIAVHCGALAEPLVESELFGHEKGAFTGALRKKPGKFEMAQRGTIFLDEIGTISPAVQVKLLQVLQDGTFSRVGGDGLLNCDVRVIAATNSDLKRLTADGGFRKDLYYRLNVFPVETLPLRERLEDIPQLVSVCLKKLNAQYGKNIHDIHPVVLEAFRSYRWPGNIRELENLLERAYILEGTDTLGPQVFPSDLVPSDGPVSFSSQRQARTLAEARTIALAEFERGYLRALVSRNRGKINLSAREAAISPRQLNRLMTRYHIFKDDFKRTNRAG